jgi:hypothetical protein
MIPSNSQRNWLPAAAAALATLALLSCAKTEKPGKTERAGRTSEVGYEDTPILPGQPWRVHDIKRPHPKVVTPGIESSQGRPGTAPSDAVVLFDGKDLSQWVTQGLGADKGKLVTPRWKLENGYVEVTGEGDLITREKFGDCQLHLEWTAPPGSADSSQWRSNSGVMLMGHYEIQVLDSYQNPTYADGQAASIYGQWPPLANAMRKPGEWQAYDIVFEAPRFEGGKLGKPAFVTMFHNGVLMHHRQEILGGVRHREVATYAPHGAEEPLLLQNHDVPARYRNIWIRRLSGYDQPEK